MAQIKELGDCENCRQQFGYCLIHNGFNETAYAYCDACGTTALLDEWKVPPGVKMKPHQNITPAIETHLAPCRCEGSFKAGASPRCPHCRHTLSAIKATGYIESQAEGTKKGWRWQRAWTGQYCIIIDDKVVHNVWKTS